jgi:molecular chaperone HscB
MTHTSNYFEFFGLQVALKVDAASLRKSYLENSKQYHPDFHTLASVEEQAKSLELSTLNNEAYKTLSDPDRLIGYVLKLKGLLKEEGGNEKLPSDFLMEVMEINEKIIELEFDPNPQIYSDIILSVNDLQSRIKTDISTIIDTWNEASAPPEELEKVKEYFLKKRYLLRVNENLSKFAPAFE